MWPLSDSNIPQDALLFIGTMRSHLDQFGDYSHIEIWLTLEQVQLKRLGSEVLAHGLQSILEKSKILRIYEVTANVDTA
jgi:ABC-type multidrug transport system fused ATPase/permease subunit